MQNNSVGIKKQVSIYSKMLKNREIIHRYIYIFALTVLGVMLPWSEFLMSAVQFLLLGNWILEGGFKQKLKILKERKSIVAFISIILVHFIWLLNTSNIPYALHDIQIKIPLLILPLIIGTSKILTKKEFYIILKFFTISVFLATLFSVAVYLGYTKFEYTDYRSISVFISHIRFSLMIVMAIVISVYFIVKENGFKIKILISIVTLWLMFFILFLQSLTGIIITSVIIIIASFITINSIKKTSIKLITLFILTVLIIYSALWLTNSITKINYVNNNEKIELFTINNNPYDSKNENYIRENGNRVYINISKKELEKSWNSISTIEFDSNDKKNNTLRFTLYRYLSSKTLSKDSVGISKLTNQDIINIENGMPNYLFENKTSAYVILYKLMQEYSAFKNTNDINNKSILQRIEYSKIGKQIFNNNLWLGVGTGDVQDIFTEYYNNNNSNLSADNRNRAHNQILTFLLSFGIIGFAIILIGFVYPLLFEKNKNKVLLFFFLIIALLSFLNEDTLETQPGVTFISFFYVLFVFGYKKTNEE